MQSRRAEQLPKGSRLVITVLIASLWVIQVRQASAFAASPVQEDTAARVDAVDTMSQRIAHGHPKPPFDPDRVAYLEAAGWQAYYDRNWPRVFSLMVQMNREQFRMSLPTAIAAAIDIVRASIAFAPVDNDVPAAPAHLRRFYDKVRRSAGLHAEAQALAALEMDYWVVHRRLAFERKQAPNHEGDIEPMVASLARLHAALFDAPISRVSSGGSQNGGSNHRRLLDRCGRRLAPGRGVSPRSVSQPAMKAVGLRSNRMTIPLRRLTCMARLHG
jgi:hypothetical protein